MRLPLRQTESKLKDLIKSQGTICAGLLDSENISPSEAAQIAARVEKCGAKAILVGGSTAVDQIELEEVVKTIKKSVTSPVILFPGNVTGVSPSADAIFFSCLMNSDNPYFITEAQALGALAIRKYDLEAIPMAYLIVGDGGAAGFIGRAKGIPPEQTQSRLDVRARRTVFWHALCVSRSRIGRGRAGISEHDCCREKSVQRHADRRRRDNLSRNGSIGVKSRCGHCCCGDHA